MTAAPGQPVVFGIDFSPMMRRAIPWVREFIAPNQPVILVHAVDEPPLPGFLGRGVPRRLAADEVCPLVLARLRSLSERSCAFDAETVTRPGPADQVLDDVARERSASMIVIGAHGVPARAWRRLGTTAERLLRAAERPLLVVKGPLAGPPKRMLVAVDDAGVTPCVLATAGRIADDHDAELTAIHVLSPAAYNHMISAEAAQSAADAETQRRIDADMAEETLRWLRALWQNTRRHAELRAEIPHGKPADEILRVARDQSVDLIVMGRYGVGRVLPAILGSVVGSVVAGADCPVLVVT